ncbi:MAG: hypothetical protein A4S09_02525 [Proteobacteria bacterium SG_bin7]|nr:MAG: hypothetical protein A4S09_02525 [Proteobacteria bacterium SG_bin7]
MSTIKRYIPKRFLPAAIWFRNGPMADLYTVLLVVFPWLGVFLRFLRKAVVLSFWIKEGPYKNSVAIDLKKLGADPDTILKNFSLALINLINSTSRKGAIHLSVEVPADQFKLVTDLQALTKTLPQSNYGDVEFFISHEDRVGWQVEAVSGKEMVAEIMSFEIDLSLASRKLVPPAHYQNWGRSFLKSLGAHRKVYFCNFEDAGAEFFERNQDLQRKCIFLVNTPASISSDLHYRYGNVVYLSRLGLSTAEKIALVHICDGYVGQSDVYGVFAEQRGLKGSEKNQAFGSHKNENFATLEGL